MRRILAAAPAAFLLAAAAAFAARVDLGQVLNIPQAFWSNLLVIGATDDGSVAIDGGTQVEEDSVALGGFAAASGSLSVTGAGSKRTTTGDPVTRASAVAVANAGEGSVTIAAGGVVDVDGTASEVGDLGAGFALAIEAGSLGSATVEGAGSQLLVRNGAAAGAGVAVGLAGEGSLLVRDGAEVQVDTGSGENSGTTVGNGAGAVGTLTVTGPGSTYELLGTGRGLTVGNAGSGELVVEDGGVFSGAQVAFLGLEATGSGTLRVGANGHFFVDGTNPLLGFGGSLSVGLAGQGTVLLEGGDLQIGNPDGIVHGLQVGGATGCGGPCPQTGGSGEVALEGGASLAILGPLGGASIGADGTGTLRVAGGSTFDVEDETNGGVNVGASPGSSGEVLVTGGSLLDAGSGLLLGVDLALADTGTARLEVADGSVVDGGLVTLGSDGTLAGDGTLMGSVASRGTIAPGASIGTLTLVGPLVQEGGTLRFELAGTGAGEADHLAVSGDLELPVGAVRVDLVDGFLPEVGDEVVLAVGESSLTVDTSAAPSYAGAAPGFSFEVVAEGTDLVFRALSAAEGFGACQVSQLKAFSKLCKKLFDCEAAFAKKPAKDPGGTKRDACRGKGEDVFAKAWGKAAAKAAAKGEPCGLAAPAAEAAAVVGDPADALVAEVGTGWEPGTSGDDDALRSALLRETGRLCGAFLAAASGNAKKRDVAKRDAARERARGSFDTKTGKAFQKAAEAGVVYTGPAADVLAGETLDLAKDATSRSAGVSP